MLLLALRPEGVHADPVSAEFDGHRAYRDLTDLEAIGPRPSRSAGASAARELIRGRLRQAGWVSTLHSPSDGLARVIAVREGKRADRIVVATHFDTKHLPHADSLGANDGASGPALLLELARALAGDENQSEICLVFFDGHEPIGHEITTGDGLRGSSALAREWEQSGVLDKIRAMIVVDQVADKQIDLTPSGETAPELVALLRPLAAAAGVELDETRLYRFPNDHTPFRNLGVRPIASFIDYELGGRPAPGSIWHSLGDNLGNTSEESLARIGKLVFAFLKSVDRAP